MKEVREMEIRTDIPLEEAIDALIFAYGKKAVRGWFPQHRALINASTSRRWIGPKELRRFC